MLALFVPDDTAMRILVHLKLGTRLLPGDRAELVAAIQHATLKCDCGKGVARDR